MKETIKFRFAGIGIMAATCAVFGAAVMLLWNALMPHIFGFPELNYLQATGLLLLARILFGGLGAGHLGMGAYGLSRRVNPLRERWMNMSEDERKEFRRGQRDFSHIHEFFNEQPGSGKSEGEKSE